MGSTRSSAGSNVRSRSGSWRATGPACTEGTAEAAEAMSGEESDRYRKAERAFPRFLRKPSQGTFDELERLRPYLDPAWFFWAAGKRYRMAGEFEPAATSFRESLRRDPNSPLAPAAHVHLLTDGGARAKGPGRVAEEGVRGGVAGRAKGAGSAFDPGHPDASLPALDEEDPPGRAGRVRPADRGPPVLVRDRGVDLSGLGRIHPRDVRGRGPRRR